MPILQMKKKTPWVNNLQKLERIPQNKVAEL